jgi:hypothetical protein
MRTLAPALAFAISCTGAHAAPAARPAPASDAGALAWKPEPDGGPAPVVATVPDDPAAIAALGTAHGAAAVPAIVGKLSSADLAVRRAAVEALGRIGGPDVRAALQKQLDAETHPEIRAAIERAMAEASP